MGPNDYWREYDVPENWNDPETPTGTSEEEYEAFYSDMAAAPAEFPTAEEVEDMARRAGEDVPF